MFNIRALIGNNFLSISFVYLGGFQGNCWVVWVFFILLLVVVVVVGLKLGFLSSS